MIPRLRSTMPATALSQTLLLLFTQLLPVAAQDGDRQFRLPRPARSVTEAFLLAAAQEASGQQAAKPPIDASELTITVLEGEDHVNIIKKNTAVTPVVEVRDRNKNPVAGAAVTFTLPSQGASGTFLNGSHVFTAVTDSAGRATAAFHPVGQGAMKIAVSASYQGHTAVATIAQTNAVSAAAATGGSTAGAAAAHSHVLLYTAIAAGAATAAAVGAVVATSGSSKPSAGLSLGTVTIGPPK